MLSPQTAAAVGLPLAVPAQRATGARRLYFVDNLRVGLTFLVIAHHVGQAYCPTGGAWPIKEAARTLVLAPFCTVNRSFFMSLFFVISGYFMVMSYDAVGSRAFMKSRLARLGIPLLVWALLMVPFQIFANAPAAGGLGSAWPIDVGHMWYAEHLLIFSLCYVIWHAVRPRRSQAGNRLADPPGYLPILVFALLLAVANGIIRIWYPIDRWVYPLGFVRVAFSDVPCDLSFFVIGALAYRHLWLQRFPTKAG